MTNETKIGEISLNPPNVPLIRSQYVDKYGDLVDADKFYATLKPQEEIPEQARVTIARLVKIQEAINEQVRELLKAVDAAATANLDWRKLLIKLVDDETAVKAAAMAAISKVTAPLKRLQELLLQQWETTEPTCRTKRS